MGGPVHPPIHLSFIHSHILLSILPFNHCPLQPSFYLSVHPPSSPTIPSSTHASDYSPTHLPILPAIYVLINSHIRRSLLLHQTRLCGWLRPSPALRQCSPRWTQTHDPHARPRSISSVLKACVVSETAGTGERAMCWLCRQTLRDGFLGQVTLFIHSCPTCLLRKSPC